MSFKGAIINKLNGGLGRNTGSDRVIVLVAGMTLVEDLAYNKAYEILDISTAEALGITESTDDTNSELVHYHLSEMFLGAPESKFYVIPVDKTKTPAALVADAAFKTAIRGIEGINVIGIAGLSTPVSSALADAVTFQTLVTGFLSEFIYIDGIFVEGVGGAAALAIADYPDLRTLDAQNIHYVIAQDPAIAALKAGFAKRAALGTVLGAVGVRKVHEDLGSVDIEVKPASRRGEESYSLTNEGLGRWLTASLSDGTKFSALTAAEHLSLTQKGWIYAGKFAGYDGYYLNGCPGAVDASSDYAYFNYNCIWNKAARIIRKTLIPRVRSKVPKDPATGYIKSSWVSGAEQTVINKLGAMISAGNIDGADVYINPAQSVSETTPMAVRALVVVGDVVHEFSVDLGLTNKL